MRYFAKNILLIFSFLLFLSIILSLFAEKSENKKTVSFSTLATKIKEGEVKSITIRGNTIEATLNDGKRIISEKEPNSSFLESLKIFDISPQLISEIDLKVENSNAAAFWIGLFLQTVLPFLLILLLFWYLSRQAQKGATQALSFGKANIRIFSPGKERVTFQDVAGLKEAKEELVEIVEFLKNPKKFLDLGARIPRGVLLMGAPGTGKTLLARAVAGEANVPFFHISGSEFVEMFVGVGAARVRDLFTTAKKMAPSIVFIDEIDAVGRERGAGLGGGHDEREQTLNQILVEMDGFERDTNVIVMAATNRPDILDPALLRPGRFDRRVVLDLPDVKEREEILRIHLKNKKVSPNINIKKIAQRTPGFAGADLANLVNEAAILAARRNKNFIGEEEMLDAMEKVILGPERKSHILSQKEREVTAYHEAGHALVAASLPNADPVHKVSIVSRGRAAGYTLKLPIEDKHLYTRSHFLDELATMLGGYSAEEIVFNEITTGAANDLREASELARRLVTQYGMSKRLGPITYGRSTELMFLGKEIVSERNYSEKIAAEIDKEVKRLIDSAHKTARNILQKKRHILDRIAKKLMEVETLEREDFEALLKMEPAKVKIQS
jgi:cell division protease FtsH